MNTLLCALQHPPTLFQSSRIPPLSRQKREL
jgi:hypothetical protein